MRTIEGLLPPDCTLTVIDDGHDIVGPGGRFRTRGASPHDQVLYIDDVGLFNVTRAWKQVSAIMVPIDVPTAALLGNVQNRPIDESVIQNMTEEHLNSPILSAKFPSGAQVIDGVHRVYARSRFKMTVTRTFVLTEAQIAKCAVTFEKIVDGQAIPFDPRKGGLLG
jgi:hypothetical protein